MPNVPYVPFDTFSLFGRKKMPSAHDTNFKPLEDDTNAIRYSPPLRPSISSSTMTTSSSRSTEPRSSITHTFNSKKKATHMMVRAKSNYDLPYFSRPGVTLLPEEEGLINDCDIENINNENDITGIVNVTNDNAENYLRPTQTVTHCRGRSLSIGDSRASLQFISKPFISINSDKTQTTHKQKAEKSNTNAAYQQFFDKQIKPTISPSDIRREGLKALLFSSIPLGYFLYHLLNEYSSENLFFYLAVENYQNHYFPDQLARQHTADEISRTYLSRGAELETNLEDKVYRNLQKALERQRTKSFYNSAGDEFNSAKCHVFTLLNSSYHRFRTSTIWSIMESKCRHTCTIDTKNSQALVVSLLLSHIAVVSNEIKNNRFNNTTSSTLSEMVHCFCQAYLPEGYYEANVGMKEGQQTKEDESKNLEGEKKSFISSKLYFFKSYRGR